MPTDPTAPCPVCTADVALVDGHLVTHRHRDQFGPCPAGQVEPAATGDKLAEAIAELRALTTCRCRSEYALSNGHESECVELWREEVDTVAAALTYRAVRIEELERELSRTVADCGICRLGGRTIQINDDCPRHGDTDGEGP